MIFSFDPQQGLVIVKAEISGPSGSVVLRMALDTGASNTVVNVGMLVAVGYDPALVPDRVQVTTGSNVEFVPRITLDRIQALGQERSDLLVFCHTLPPSANVDGLLGLDFVRGQLLTIDFRAGEVRLV